MSVVKKLYKLYPYALVVIGFIMVSVLYFNPILKGKALYQSDIAQYIGMAKEQNDFRAEENSEPYWASNAFGGMPTYQMGAKYPHNYIKKIDDLIRFLPRPADYLFLYFVGFFVLLKVLKTDNLKAFFGALAFGFSTYLIVILGVGHNAKAHAIGYMPLVVAGVLLVFQRRYIIGFLLTLFATALEICANHFQMTYYLLIVLICIGFYYTYIAVISKMYKDFGLQIGLLFAAVLLAVGMNATSILATSEYASFSMRGKNELLFNPDGSKNTTQSAMTTDYITEYSYGIAESLNLLAPRLFGGSNSEKLDETSNVYEFISKQGASPEEALSFTTNYGITYWGNQPIVAAPAYIGIVVFYLAILCLYSDNRKIKYAFLIGAIFSLMLSWGKNFPLLTDFLIAKLPLYDKFRAVSSIQVVLELCMPILAIMGFQSFFSKDNKSQKTILYKTATTVFGVILLLYIGKFFFNFVGAIDGQLLSMMSEQTDKSFGNDFIRALRMDREALYGDDVLRSGVLVLLVSGALFLYVFNKISNTIAVVAIGILMVGDLLLVSNNYFDKSNFISKQEVAYPFLQTAADSLILADKSNFRVFEVEGRLQARTSFFHKSVGGYSAVRPRRFDQLFEYELDRKIPELVKNIDQETMSLISSNQILDMLNVKYLIFAAKNGDVPVRNPFAKGDAWFVSNIKLADNANEEFISLQKSDLQTIAIANKDDFQKNIKTEANFVMDSLSTIVLTSNKPNQLIYKTSNKGSGFAVFSEMYYPNGWKVFIDGTPASHIRVNYVLRGMAVPAGNHTIEFKFDPEVVKTGSMIALICSVLALILLLFGILYKFKKKTI